ncbi:MAG: hypothetical protein PHE83_17425 [Opitutaceae bacterium]|nr:hypothetical protein [Opitutaceae bacterium]
MRYSIIETAYPDRDPVTDCTRRFYSGFSLLLADETGRTQRIALLRNTPRRAREPDTYFAAFSLRCGPFISRRQCRSTHEYIALSAEALREADLAIAPAAAPLLDRIDAAGRFHYLTAPLAAFTDEEWKTEFLAPSLAERGFFIFGLNSHLGQTRETISLGVCGILLNTHGPSTLYQLAQLAFDCESGTVDIESIHPGMEKSPMLLRLETLIKTHNAIARDGGKATLLFSEAGMEGLKTRFARDVICAM